MPIPKHFDDLLDCVPVMIDALTPDNHVAYWNRECERVSGYTRLEMLNDRNLVRCSYPDIGSFVENALLLLLNGETPRNLESLLVPRMGQLRTIAWSIMLLPRTDGVQYLWRIGIDVTKRNRAHAEQERQRKLLNRILETLPDGVCWKSGQGRWLQHNALAADLLDVPGGDFRGLTNADLARRYPKRGARLADCHRLDEETWRFGRETRTPEVVGEDAARQRYFDVVRKPFFLDGHVRDGLLVVARDVTDQARIEQELQRHKQRLEAALKATGIGIFEVDAQSGGAEVSDSYAAIFGYADSADMDLSLEGRFSRMHAADLPRAQAAYRELVEGRRDEVQMEYRARHACGAFQWFRVDGRVADRNPEGRPTRLIGIIQNIERFRAAQDQARLSRGVFENSRDGIIITDTDGHILAANPAFTSITGYTAPEAIGQTPRLLKSGRHDARFYRRMWGSLLRNGAWQGEIWDRKKSGEIYPEWLSIVAVREMDTGVPTHYVATFSDLTEIKAARALVDHALRHDPLTGLPNGKTLAELSETKDWERYSLVLVDIDHFKLINDAHGHAFADLVLVAVAERLRTALCHEEHLARHGSDEFIIATRRSAGDRASELLGLFESPFRIANHELSLTVSIGGCSYPDDGGDFITLLHRAESATLAAKSSGRNTFRYYRAQLDAGASRRLAILDGLRRATPYDGLALHFQPQVDLGSGAVVGFEALMRWRNSVLGDVSPAEFIPLSEESGKIVDLGAWALATACRQLALWQRAGFTGTIAVNVSAIQIQRGILSEQVCRVLAEIACDPAGLKLEITESLFLDAPQTVLDMLLDLKRLGISLAIDDFGTGYSNLAYLCRLDVDEIKIDRAFVANLSKGEADVAIVRAIIQMADAIGAGVVAEGIEDAKAAARLVALGCRCGQGYFFGHPVAAEALSFNVR